MNEDIKVRGWLDRRTVELEHEPDYVAEGIALRFVEELLQIMAQTGMSPGELANRLGVSRAYVSKILNAPPNLTLRSIAAVALALGARPELNLIPAAASEASSRRKITQTQDKSSVTARGGRDAQPSG